MISKEFAKKQVLRVAPRMFQPTDEQLEDLVKALMAIAESETHAADIIGSFVYDSGVTENGRPTCPSPGDITRVGHATRKTELRAVPACPACSGSGWRIVERDGISGAARCGCWKARPKEPDRRTVASDPEVAREFAIPAKAMPKPRGERFQQ